MRDASFAPLWVAELELGGAPRLVPVSTRRPDHRQARVLVRLHGDPLGYVVVPAGDDDATRDAAVAAAIRLLGDEIRAHLADDGAAPDHDVRARLADTSACPRIRAAEPRATSVVVCTRNRPDRLEGCFSRLAALEHPAFEVIVVDNAPSDDRTHRRFRELVGDDPRFRYVVEPEMGLSRARNLGAADARHDLVAFTDDDTLVDPHWLSALARGFDRDPAVGCVTGLVPAAQLDTPAQQYFDERSGWSSSMRPHLVEARTAARGPIFEFDDRDDLPAVHPFGGVLGAGANFAVERSLILEIGGFDPALGPGTPVGGGDDRDFFYRVLFHGRKLAFEPSAVVWHLHRATEDELAAQLYTWGTTPVAIFLKLMGDRTVRRRIAGWAPPAILHAFRMMGKGTVGGHRSLPTSGRIILTELRGMVAGPFVYRRSLRSARAVATRHG